MLRGGFDSIIKGISIPKSYGVVMNLQDSFLTFNNVPLSLNSFIFPTMFKEKELS